MYTKNIMLFSLFLVINSTLILGMNKKDSTSISNTREPLEVFLWKRLPIGMRTPNLPPSMPNTQQGMIAYLESTFSSNPDPKNNEKTCFCKQPIDFIVNFHKLETENYK